MVRPAASARADSRARLLAAARTEFALRGFAGASVDRIARKARLNKAMIYYHFASKDGLYREIIRDLFEALGRRVTGLRAGSAPPPDKLRAFIDALADEVMRRPDFAPMMMRELAEQGRHLDAPTVAVVLAVPETFVAIVSEGVALGLFRPMHPMVAYFAVLGPIALSLAGLRLRDRLVRLAGRELPFAAREELVAQVQAAAQAMLAPPGRPRAPRARSHS